MDLALIDFFYDSQYNLKNDFVGPTGAYEIHLLSGPPHETPKYHTLISPFDPYVWAFTLTSIGAVTISLIIIDHIQATWSGGSTKDVVMTGWSNKK